MFIIRVNIHPEALIRLYIFEVLRVKEHILIPYSFVVFTFEFVVESIQ
jgi:hypothetical protein